MRRYLGPRLELTSSDTSLYRLSRVRTVDGHHLVDDQLALKGRLEAECCHGLSEGFDARVH